MAGRFAVSEAIACAGSALATMSIVGAVQFAVLGTVGLILCCLAAFGGVMLYCLVKRRGQRDWLMRSRVLKMAPIVRLGDGRVWYACLRDFKLPRFPGLSDPNQSSLVPYRLCLYFGGILGIAATVVGGILSLLHITGGHSTDPYGGPKELVVLRWTRMMGKTKLIHHILNGYEQ